MTLWFRGSMILFPNSRLWSCLGSHASWKPQFKASDFFFKLLGRMGIISNEARVLRTCN